MYGEGRTYLESVSIFYIVLVITNNFYAVWIKMKKFSIINSKKSLVSQHLFLNKCNNMDCQKRFYTICGPISIDRIARHLFRSLSFFTFVVDLQPHAQRARMNLSLDWICQFGFLEWEKAGSRNHFGMETRAKNGRKQTFIARRVFVLRGCTNFRFPCSIPRTVISVSRYFRRKAKSKESSRKNRILDNALLVRTLDKTLVSRGYITCTYLIFTFFAVWYMVQVLIHVLHEKFYLKFKWIYWQFCLIPILYIRYRFRNIFNLENSVWFNFDFIL